MADSTSKPNDRRPFHVFNTHDDETWRLLYERQIPLAEQYASLEWLNGLTALGLKSSRVPDFTALNETFKELVDWELVSTDVVYSDGQDWFEHLNRRQFLITEYIRERKDLEYTPLPDIWHDAFGHLPFLTNQRYADYLQKFGKYAIRYTPEERKSLGSLWWYTIEFGFMMENGEMKAFGAGLLSSPGELQRALSDEVEKVPFDITAFENLAPSPHVMHNKLFILESFQQVEEALELWVTRKEQNEITMR